LKDILMVIENGNAASLPKPYMADIVGNTLCSDLLDYVQRDLKSVGLRENFDNRFLSYLYIDKVDCKYHVTEKVGGKEKRVEKESKKDRLVLRLVKPRTLELRRDVQSELLHLLRLRYSLAEKVYFHHTKIYSSSMIISAVADTYLDMDDDAQKRFRELLLGMSDDSLVQWLRAEGTARSKAILELMFGRQLYKPLYGLRYGGEDDPHFEAKDDLIKRLKDPMARRNLEIQLEEQSFLKTGSISIYCPGTRMGFKEMATIVNYGAHGIGKLEEIAPERVASEIKSSITDKHLELWAMYVLCPADLEREQKENVHSDCENYFRLGNEIAVCDEYLEDRTWAYLFRYEERYSAEHDNNEQLKRDEIRAIASAEHRSIDENRTDDDDRFGGMNYSQYCQIREDLYPPTEK
jgi:HD superfamily phosphohydrolase